MKIPSKIYISKSKAVSLGSGETDRAVCYPKDIEGSEMVEYTNLSAKWHDARKEKQPQGVCGNNAVLVVALRNGRVAYKYLWTDMEDCWKDLDLLTPPTKKVYDKVLWAYVRDLVPGAKGKGE